MNRLVHVSNRVALPGAGFAAGGLGTVLRDALASRGGLWFGWDGRINDDPTAPIAHARAGGIDYATLPLSESEHREHYLGFCNQSLWPALHGLPAANAAPSWYRSYRDVNARFARALLPLLRATDSLWVHDFHLLPLPATLRRLGARQALGFFFHTPFADSALARATPQWRQLLADLSACQAIGFQSADDRDAFIRAHAAAQPGPLTAELGVWPVCTAAQRPAVPASTVELRRAGRRRLLGMDRADPAKGLIQKLAGLERLVERDPTVTNRIEFRQIAVPTRVSLPSYRRHAMLLRRRARTIAQRFPAAGGEPWLLWTEGSLPHAAVLRELASADVCCVTPLRDGMNLIAKEFIATQDPEEPGVLVLARGAGAARELDAALLVDALDPDDIASALAAALRMSLEERRERHRALLLSVRRRGPADWAEDLARALRPGSHDLHADRPGFNAPYRDEPGARRLIDQAFIQRHQQPARSLRII